MSRSKKIQLGIASLVICLGALLCLDRFLPSPPSTVEFVGYTNRVARPPVVDGQLQQFGLALVRLPHVTKARFRFVNSRPLVFLSSWAEIEIPSPEHAVFLPLGTEPGPDAVGKFSPFRGRLSVPGSPTSGNTLVLKAGQSVNLLVPMGIPWTGNLKRWRLRVHYGMDSASQPVRTLYRWRSKWSEWINGHAWPAPLLGETVCSEWITLPAPVYPD